VADNDLFALSFALHSSYGNTEQHEYCEDYEATDVESWSCAGSNVPARNESTLKLYMKKAYIAQLV